LLELCSLISASRTGRMAPIMKLDLTGAGLADKEMHPLAAAIASPQCALVSLSLANNRISGEGLGHLRDAITQRTTSDVGAIESGYVFVPCNCICPHPPSVPAQTT
jgi:hypothetical protein